jgi:hypothetical protein
VDSDDADLVRRLDGAYLPNDRSVFAELLFESELGSRSGAVDLSALRKRAEHSALYFERPRLCTTTSTSQSSTPRREISCPTFFFGWVGSSSR